MKFVALVSGGKDSVYAAMECVALGHELVCAANLAPPPTARRSDGVSAAGTADGTADGAADGESTPLETDSFMYQTVGHDVVPALAACLGVPLVVGLVRGAPLHQGLAYTSTAGDEVEDLLVLLADVARRYPEVNAVCSGAVLSTYQRLRVESVCDRLGLRSLAPLWQRPQGELVDEMIAAGVECVLCKVASIGLDPHRHLNMPLAQLRPLLANLNVKYGVHECGEGGEYESLCLDSPLFLNAKIVLDRTSVVLHGASGDVGLLQVHKWHTEAKAAAKPQGSGGGGAAATEPRHPAVVVAVDEAAAHGYLAARAAAAAAAAAVAAVPDAESARHKSSTAAPSTIVSMGPAHAANDFVFAPGVAAVPPATSPGTPPDTRQPPPSDLGRSNEDGRLVAWLNRWAVDRTSWHLGAVVHPCLAKFEARLLLPPHRVPRVLVPLAGKAHDVAYLATKGCDVVAVECAPLALNQFLAAYPGAVAADDLGPQPQPHAVASGGGAAFGASGAALFRRSAVTLPPLQLPQQDEKEKPKETRLPPRAVLWLQGDFLALRDSPHAASSADARPPEATMRENCNNSSGSGDDSNISNGDGSDGHLFDAAFDRGGLVAVAPADRPLYAHTLARLLKPATGRMLLVCTEHPPFAGGSLGPPHSVLSGEVGRLFGGAFAIELLQVEDRLDAEPSWRDRGCTWFREATYILTRNSAVADAEVGENGNTANARSIGGAATVTITTATATTAAAADGGAADRAAAQCGSVLTQLGLQLVAAGCDGGLNDAAFVHLYLRDMNHFASVNSVYCRHFGTLQPASRSCVAALLPPGVDVLADCVALRGSATSAARAAQPQSHAAGAGSALSQRRAVLHVQSLSKWAPLCIGPYCQANTLLRGALLLLAGQIGLVPETMELARAAAAAPKAIPSEAAAAAEQPSAAMVSSEAAPAAVLSGPSSQALAELDQATWNAGQLLAALHSAWAVGRGRSGPLAAVLYVNTGATNPATSAPEAMSALRKRCLRNCRSSSGGGDASSEPSSWPPKPSEASDAGADGAVFPLLVVGVPDLPKGAAVELEVAALASAAVEALKPQRRVQHFAWRSGSGGHPLPAEPSPPLTTTAARPVEGRPASAAAAWLPAGLPPPRPLPETLAPRAPPASSLPPERAAAASADAADVLEAAALGKGSMHVTVDVAAARRVLAFGFVHVQSSAVARCSLDEAAAALVAGVAVALFGSSDSSSSSPVPAGVGAALGWRSLGHLRVFYVPGDLDPTAAATAGPTADPKTDALIPGPNAVAAAVRACLAAAGAPGAAVAAVPVSALPTTGALPLELAGSDGFGHGSVCGGGGDVSTAAGGACVLAGQLTALDALQFETAQWVATLGAATATKTPVAPATLTAKTPAETPVARIAVGGSAALRAAAAPKAASVLTLSPAPARAATPPGAGSMDDEAFGELFGVDFGAIGEGAEVESGSDED